MLRLLRAHRRADDPLFEYAESDAEESWFPVDEETKPARTNRRSSILFHEHATSSREAEGIDIVGQLFIDNRVSETDRIKSSGIGISSPSNDPL